VGEQIIGRRSAVRIRLKAAQDKRFSFRGHRVRNLRMDFKHPDLHKYTSTTITEHFQNSSQHRRQYFHVFMLSVRFSKPCRVDYNVILNTKSV